MTALARLRPITLLALAAAGCTGSDEGAMVCTPTVTPANAAVLTCTTQPMVASLPASCEQGVTWSVAGGGSVDASGVYTAPIQVPSPATATVTATSMADETATATATLTLSTALPQPPVQFGVAADDTFFQQQVAASGKRAYAVMVTVDKTQAQAQWALGVAHSDDGGATWSQPVPASNAGSTVAIAAPAIAIDAGDPNTVYVSYWLNAGSAATTAALTDNDSGATVALAVSTDGGATFKNYVLKSTVSGFGEWPNVASPKPGSVVVEVPGSDPAGFIIFTDANKGAGFAQATQSGSTFTAPGNAALTPVHAGVAYNYILMDGGSEGYESPRLVSDGKGNVCILYVAGYYSGNSDGQRRVAAQCAKNGGTFGAPVDVSVDSDTTQSHHAIAAFGPNGELVVAWWRLDPLDQTKREIVLATSSDGGATFGVARTLPEYKPATSAAKPQYPALAWDGDILWMAYLNSADGPRGLVVDKSCDGGTTWSGAQLINGPEPVTQDFQWPGLVLVDGKMALYARKGASSSDDEPYQLIRLVP